MVPNPKLGPVELSDEELSVLTGWARRRKAAQALALWSLVVLSCAEGSTIGEVTQDLGVSQNTVSKWRSRSCPTGSKGSRTSLVLVDPVRSETSMSSG